MNMKGMDKGLVGREKEDGRGKALGGGWGWAIMDRYQTLNRRKSDGE